MLQYDDLFINYSGLYKVIHFAITICFYRYNCKLPRDYYSKTCQCPHNLCTMTLRWSFKCRSLTFRYTQCWNFVQGGGIRRCINKKLWKNIKIKPYQKTKKEMLTIFYELANYYLVLTNKALNVPWGLIKSGYPPPPHIIFMYMFLKPPSIYMFYGLIWVIVVEHLGQGGGGYSHTWAW